MPHQTTREAAERYLDTLDDMLITTRRRVNENAEGGTRLIEKEAALEYAIEAVKGRMALLGWLKAAEPVTDPDPRD